MLARLQPLQIDLRQLLIPRDQRLHLRSLKFKMLLQLRCNHGLGNDIVLIVKILLHEAIGRLHIVQNLLCHRKLRNQFPQALQGHGLITQRRRRLTAAFPTFQFRTLEALFRNGLAVHRSGTGLQKMVDLLLRIRRIITFIGLREGMDQFHTSLKYRQIGNHSVPVML